MLCSLPLGTACKQQVEYVATAIKPAPERMMCVAAGKRPSVQAEYVIDWSKVEVVGNSGATLANAKEEMIRLVTSVRLREGVVTAYILRIEGQLFACANNAAWLRDFFAGLPDR